MRGAKDRVKQMLPFKLGEELIRYHKQRGGGFGFLILLKNLFFISFKHFKEQREYEKIIRIFPHLKKPSLEYYEDYFEALRLQNKTTFKLGKALLESYKTWYQGSHLKFYFKYLKFKKIREHIQNKIEFNHFQSFDFLDKHFDEVKTWIKSPKFKEKYQNHPYPPLLDPDTLDYDSVEAELAWDFNLPLPRNYKFIYFTNGSSAFSATCTFFRKSNVGISSNWTWGFDKFKLDFDFLKRNKNGFNILLITRQNVKKEEAELKYINLISKKVPIFYIVRDPIERLQHGVNHINNSVVDSKITPLMKRFNLTCDYINLFPKIIFKFELSIPHLSSLKDNRLSEEVLMFDSFLTLMHEKIDFIHCVEFKKLKPEFAYETWCDLAQKFGFKAPRNPEIFKNRINRNRGDLVHLPVELYIHPADLKHRFIKGEQSEVKQNTLSLSMQGGFSLIITLPHYLNEEQKTFKELSEEFFNEKLIISDTQILLIIKQQDYENLKKIKALYEATKEYIKGYIEALKAEVKRNKANLYSEEELLEYLKIDSNLRKEIKELCNSELAYIKENHPDFIASWKYYNEFEKMCKELDEIK